MFPYMIGKKITTKNTKEITKSTKENNILGAS